MVLPIEDTTPLSFPLPSGSLESGQLRLDKDCVLREETVDERECCLGAAQPTLSFCLLVLPVSIGGGLGILVVESSELRLQDPHSNASYYFSYKFSVPE